MEQMMGHLAAAIEKVNGKIDPLRKRWTPTKKGWMPRESNQEKMETIQEESKVTGNRHQEKMAACLAEIKAWQNEMMICQEMINACLESKEPA
jgi:hypothetical protein